METTAWEPVDSSGEVIETNGSIVLKTFARIMAELEAVNQGRYETERAKKVAALALRTQMDMLDLLGDSEARCKVMKVMVETEESKAYFEVKKEEDKKITEAALKHSINIRGNVQTAKKDLIDAEKESKRWQNIFNTLKDAHIFFRNYGNGGF